MRTYITSDLHIRHTNMVRGISKWPRGYRDFDNQLEHDNAIFDNINSMVMQNDTLIIAGDLAFGDKYVNCQYVKENINCKNLIIVKGNHDKPDALKHVFREYKDYLVYKHNDKNIVIFHYPIESWDGMSRGDIHLFGHLHSNPRKENGRSMDIGLDGNNLKPYLLDDVIDYLLSKEVHSEGHH